MWALQVGKLTVIEKKWRMETPLRPTPHQHEWRDKCNRQYLRHQVDGMQHILRILEIGHNSWGRRCGARHWLQGGHHLSRGESVWSCLSPHSLNLPGQKEGKRRDPWKNKILGIIGGYMCLKWNECIVRLASSKHTKQTTDGSKPVVANHRGPIAVLEKRPTHGLTALLVLALVQMKAADNHAR